MKVLILTDLGYPMQMYESTASFKEFDTRTAILVTQRKAIEEIRVP